MDVLRSRDVGLGRDTVSRAPPPLVFRGLENEKIALTRRERVSENELTVAFLLSIEEDVLYEFVR